MARSTTGMQVFYRLIFIIALTFILGYGTEIPLQPTQIWGLLLILAIPFIGFFFLRELPLWSRILLALGSGLLVGIIVNSIDAVEVITAITPLGTVFIKLISMLIVPLVFSTLVVGTASMGDIQKLGRIGKKTILLYLFTTMIAITIGLVLALVFQPGAGVELDEEIARDVQEMPSFVEILLDSIPQNPIKALVEGKILQVIIFAILTGICISLAGLRAKAVLNFFDGVSEVMFKMTRIVMNYAPYGVFALIAVVAGQYGMDILRPLLKVIILVYIGAFVHAFAVYGTLVKVWANLNPIRFFKSMLNAIMVAFTTSSSSATLPVTMRCVQENLGVSKDVASFVLPLGSTINMDGTALYLGVCTLFVAQFYGIVLNPGDYITIVFTAILVSIGAAGVPGAAAIMLVLVLQQIGLPPEGVALIIGIDRILDMARTCINVTGDACVSVLVAQSEDELNPPARVMI